MRLTTIVAVLCVAAFTCADVEFFFTSSAEPFGLVDPDNAFLPTAGNGTDLADGYELTRDPGGYLSPPLGCPLPNVAVNCDTIHPRWAYIWGRFVNEPPNARINGIAIEIQGAGSGFGNIVWYKCDNLNDFNLSQQFKRWDGDNNVFYFNPAGLVAITSYGLRNHEADHPANLYIGGEYRTFLLGAVACPQPCSYGELTIRVTNCSYTMPPDPAVRVCNKVVCMPHDLGDLNCDGEVDFGDINPFVLALTDPVGYTQAFPDCDIRNGDINLDGKVDFGDINPFVAVLTQP